MCVGVLYCILLRDGVQSRQSPESQLGSEEGSEQQSPQDVKESMSSWKQCGLSQPLLLEWAREGVGRWAGAAGLTGWDAPVCLGWAVAWLWSHVNTHCPGRSTWPGRRSGLCLLLTRVPLSPLWEAVAQQVWSADLSWNYWQCCVFAERKLTLGNRVWFCVQCQSSFPCLLFLLLL